MRILLAIDGSEGSYDAARALSHLAPPDELIVLHAMDIPRLSYPVTTPGIQEEYERSAREKMQQESARIMEQAEAILTPLNIPFVKRTVAGPAAEVILANAESTHADLILLGSRGLGAVSELLLGSVSHRVSTHASCATFLVKSALPRLEHVILPIQDPQDANLAVRFLGKKPFRSSIRITVLHVLPSEQHPWSATSGIPQPLWDDIQAGAEKLTGDVAEQLASLGYSATSRVEEGTAAASIIKAATPGDVDLILMGARVLSGLHRFLLGTVSHAVVHQTPCSVLLIR